MSESQAAVCSRGVAALALRLGIFFAFVESRKVRTSARLASGFLPSFPRLCVLLFLFLKIGFLDAISFRKEQRHGIFHFLQREMNNAS